MPATPDEIHAVNATWQEKLLAVQELNANAQYKEHVARLIWEGWLQALKRAIEKGEARDAH